jgi:hypothetical protein
MPKMQLFHPANAHYKEQMTKILYFYYIHWIYQFIKIH